MFQYCHQNRYKLNILMANKKGRGIKKVMESGGCRWLRNSYSKNCLSSRETATWTPFLVEHLTSSDFLKMHSLMTFYSEYSKIFEQLFIGKSFCSKFSAKYSVENHSWSLQPLKQNVWPKLWQILKHQRFQNLWQIRKTPKAKFDSGTKSVDESFDYSKKIEHYTS